MSKELTHIGMVQKYQNGERSGDPKWTRLRGTKKRWYAGDGRYDLWWPREGDGCVSNANPSQYGQDWSRGDHRLDLSTVRPMTVAELREPLAATVAHRQRLLDAAKQKVFEMESFLSEATAPLKAFDKNHDYTPEGE